MRRVCFKLKYCYGISSFEYQFGFDNQKKAFLIYAPNGTMKSSFARTLQDVCLERDTKDEFFPNRSTVRMIKHDSADGADITKNEILVINPYQEDYQSDKVSLLLADQALKREYEQIHQNVEDKMTAVIAILKRLSRKQTPTELFVRDFGSTEEKIYEVFDKVYTEYLDSERRDYTEIQYGKLFSPDAEAVFAMPDVISKLGAYLAQYDELVSKSDVFSKAFNHNNAQDTVKSLHKEGFFAAKHRVVLNKSGEPIGEKEFQQTIDAETQRIIDNALSVEFAQLDDILSKKVGTKELRAFLYEHKEIIPELADIPQLKRRIWISYLFSNIAVFTEAVLCYRSSKEKLTQIAQRAKNQATQWNAVVDSFNSRFQNMPFRLAIDNKEDVILKDSVPSIQFSFKSGNDTAAVTKKQLLTNLSEGEKKALYLLNVIFEIKARQHLQQQTLLIIDDIADSFDYRNKYAIIEYLIEIINDTTFNSIILTHNFDFYRTLASRASLKQTSYFVETYGDDIHLESGEYFNDVFAAWHGQAYTSPAVFLSAIAFVRNLVQYQDGREASRYQELTSLLHYRKNRIGNIPASDSILVSDLCGWIADKWHLTATSFQLDRSISVTQLLFDTANALAANPYGEIKLENKVMMSIAIRQQAERYMVNRINDDSKTDAIGDFQTRRLRNMIAFNKCDPADVEREKIIDRVLIITSENIHINSFMYEPIIDISLYELINLYEEVTHKLI